jgi:hypothetical protein
MFKHALLDVAKIVVPNKIWGKQANEYICYYFGVQNHDVKTADLYLKKVLHSFGWKRQ